MDKLIRLRLNRKVRVNPYVTTDPYNMRGEIVKILGWDASYNVVKVKALKNARKGLYERDTLINLPNIKIRKKKTINKKLLAEGVYGNEAEFERCGGW